MIGASDDVPAAKALNIAWAVIFTSAGQVPKVQVSKSNREGSS